MRPPRPCIEAGCPNYAIPGESRCAPHLTLHESARRADPTLTGRRSTSAEWRRARGLCLHRYDYRCARCRRSRFVIEAAGERLDVHHIDGDARNDAQINLEPLCSSCHRDTHRGQK